MSVPVSVVIPAYNAEKTLERAAMSALEAGAREVVIVDDASTDGTGDIIRAFNRKFSNISSLRTVFRSGAVHTRSLAIHATASDLIVPLDADDILYPDALERLHAAWQPGTWVYGNHTEVDEDGRVIREVEAPPPGMLHRKNLTYATMLFHKDDWRRAGGYDPDFELGAEDYAFQVALTANGVRPVKLEGEPIFQRRIHSNSRTQRAIDYFPLLHSLIRQKWPSVFKGH